MSPLAQSSLPFVDSVAPAIAANGEIRGSDYHYLRLSSDQLHRGAGRVVRIVDLFSGCGGMSLGAVEACRALDLGAQVAFASDFDPDALAVYRSNLHPSTSSSAPIESLLNGAVGQPLSASELEFQSAVGPVDLLLGGPPCQGHSDLNNSTRRRDPKNALYMVMARAAEVLKPQLIIVENVAGAAHDIKGVFQRTVVALETLGYACTFGVLNALEFGVPQSRRRLFLLARKGRVRPTLPLGAFAGESRSVRWAIGDLVTLSRDRLIDAVAQSNADTRVRIKHLFDNDLLDLPDSMRPPCHREKKHTYKSIYGRLDWDKPSQTITSGFYSMCMGRYVHPSEPRTLTAHEAARLQFLPDFFSFDTVSARGALATMIGNAVPTKLAFSVAKILLRCEN